MLTPRSGFALCAAIAVAGCASGGIESSVGIGRPAASVTQALGPDASSVVYSCQAVDSFCDVLSQNGTILKTLTSADGLNGPEGTRADALGNWYIANAQASNILEFSAKGASLIKTLDDTGAAPVDVATFGTVVAVANLDGPGSIPTSVSVYLNGSTKARRVLTDPSAVESEGVTFDSKGNCYWSFKLANVKGQIDEFTKCKGTPQNLGITTQLPGGIAFDGGDNLYYIDQTVGVYRCSGITMCGARYTGFTQAFDLNFNRGWKDLWVSDLQQANIREIDITTGMIVRSFGFEPSDPPFGVAAGPGAKF